MLKYILDTKNINVFEDRMFFTSSMDFADEYGFETHDGAKEIFYTAQEMIKDEKIANGEFALMSFTNSTDAYHSSTDASKIMSHDYANKYANYWSKKNKTIKSGKANFKDSGRQKTYNAEFKALREYKKLYPNDARFKFLDWKGSQKLFKKIAKSKTYRKLCENDIGSTVKSTMYS